MEESSRDSFKVAIRVRPRLPGESAPGSAQCVEVDQTQNTIITSNPNSIRRSSSRIGIDGFCELVRPDHSQIQNYTFDIVLGPDSSQQDVFIRCAGDIVKSVISGYNGSIIASGQTNSGKTYTIEGNKESPGIIPRAVEMIFSQIRSSSVAGHYLVRASYLQIYNEKISDLLAPSRENLKIREDGGGGVFVESLSDHIVRDTEEIMALVQQGSHLRMTNATRMNKESSRSHAVFTIIVEHEQDRGHSGRTVTVGKLRLVDLAGSERLDVDAESRRQEETKNINVSLHNFSKVVTALTTPGVKHIPYRDSKLTRILQDCLGGNCKTTMIATVTPVSECYTETMNTLKFAKRAKNIKNVAKVNQDVSEKALISSYQTEIKRLKIKLEERSKAQGMDYMKLLQEHQEFQREKEEVKTKLEAQQKVAYETQTEKMKLISRIKQLEDKFLCGGSKKVIDSDELKEALMKEQQRVKQETVSQYELKFAQLEKEKERLKSEKLEFQRMFERLHTPHPQSVSALQEYVTALSHPTTGIPCQELMSGIKMFTGSSAAHWFVKNMEGVSSVQNAQAVGQRLINLGAFIEIQGGTSFVVSSTAYYQFSNTSQPGSLQINPNRPMMSQSLGSLSHLVPSSVYPGKSGGQQSLSSSSLLSSSVASLSIGGDLLVHFGLSGSYPSELHVSCLYGDRSKVRAFIFDKHLINSTDAYGRTPLMYAVIGKQPKCCAMLLRHGAGVNLKDQCGSTAVLLAAQYEYEDVMKILLKSGAETHHTDANRRTVFHLASVSQNYKCLEYLCRYGSPAGMNMRDDSYQTPLLAAVQARFPGHVKRLLMAKADLGISDNQGRTALHYSITYNSLPCAQAIIETNPKDINLIDTAGQSVLHLACIHGSSQLLQYLLSIPSCLINLQDEKGNTALHYAVMANNLDSVGMLLSNGASVVLKNRRNMTPLQCSLEMGFDECTKILQAV